MELKDKVCLVTGGASGIGRDIAALFARHGADVVIADQNADAVWAIGGEIGAVSVHCDVSDALWVQDLIAETLDVAGRIDVLVNSAGLGIPLTMAATDERDWDELISVNLKGMFLCSKQVIPHMARRGGGSIINTADFPTATLRGIGSVGLAWNGAMAAMSKAMAQDHYQEGIRVNVVTPSSPGVTNRASGVPRVTNSFVSGSSAWQASLQQHETAREEYVEPFLFLASDRSRSCTGSVLTTGKTIQTPIVA